MGQKEEVGFLSSGTFLRPARVLPSDAPSSLRGFDSFFKIYSEIRPRKLVVHQIFGKKFRSFFYPVDASPVEKRVLKARSKFQGSPREAHEEMPKPVYYNF